MVRLSGTTWTGGVASQVVQCLVLVATVTLRLEISTDMSVTATDRPFFLVSL